MELYLDSANLLDIEIAFKMNVLTGLTTTPTFMQKENITNIDDTIIQLSKAVPLLHIEALGATADEIYVEAIRLINLGLNKHETIFKIPVSNHGIQACKKLSDEGFLVNIHLVYTLQQAYMAMIAGAAYICPLVGRLQDQGHNALSLVKKCVKMVLHYNSSAKIMFSSVRHQEHVNNAIDLGVHACTVPWEIMQKLTSNCFTTIGIQQFSKDYELMTTKVKEVVSHEKPLVNHHTSVLSALVAMTKYGFGMIIIEDDEGKLLGTFTDGDLRRYLQQEGNSILTKTMAMFTYQPPFSITSDSLLGHAIKIFRKYKIDNLIVMDAQGNVEGILTIQSLIKLNLISYHHACY